MPLHRGFAQSNGLVERTVQTAKKPLKKTYEDNKNPYSGVYFTKYFNSWRWSFFHSVCSWGVAQKHHSYKEYLAKANGLRPQWSPESAEKKKKTASSEELFWWKVQVPWTTKTWRYQSATGRNLGTSRAVGEIWQRWTKIIYCESKWPSLQAKPERNSEETRNPVTWRARPVTEVAEENNNKDPVADQLWPDDQEEFDKELKTATIHLPLSYYWSGHPCFPALPRMISLFWMTLSTKHFISEPNSRYVTFCFSCYRAVCPVMFGEPKGQSPSWSYRWVKFTIQQSVLAFVLFVKSWRKRKPWTGPHV